MDKITAIAVAKQIEKICEERDIYCKVSYDKKPQLKFIEVFATILIDTQEEK